MTVLMKVNGFRRNPPEDTPPLLTLPMPLALLRRHSLPFMSPTPSSKARCCTKSTVDHNHEIGGLGWGSRRSFSGQYPHRCMEAVLGTHTCCIARGMSVGTSCVFSPIVRCSW